MGETVGPTFGRFTREETGYARNAHGRGARLDVVAATRFPEAVPGTAAQDTRTHVDRALLTLG
jgi:hypothetical protein